MRKLIIGICLGLIVSCTPEVKPTEEIAPAESSVTVDSVALHIEAITEQLEKSDVLEHNIKKNINVATTLKQQNDKLKKELVATKDSIHALKRELIEVKSKLPKKKNLIQKLLNIAPDSIEVTTVDTIETK